MTNHVHLIVNPGKDVENLALLMKRISGRQTRHINKIEGRSGTLWEGRYKSSPIKEDEYLLACCRYVEVNPVRAGIVEDPIKYKWSSCRYKAGSERLDFDPCYKRLAANDNERRAKYKEWISKSIPDGEMEMLRRAIQRGQLTGGNKFVEEVSEKIGRRIEFRGQGRPKK